MFIKKLNPELLSALAEAGFEEPSEMQQICIPRIKSGVDLLCIAPEGAGKSSSIVISVIQRLKMAKDDVFRALVVVKDQKSAHELEAQFAVLAKNTDLRVYAVPDARDLEKIRDVIYYGMDVVIGTAKRLNELCMINGLNFGSLQVYVIDDGEMVTKQEYISQIDRLSKSVTKAQILFFAAKLTPKVERFAEEYMEVDEIHEFE